MIRASLISYLGIFLSCMGGVVLNVFFHPLVKLSGLMLLYLGGSVLLLYVCSLQMCLALFICGIGVTVLFGMRQRENPAAYVMFSDHKEWLVFRLLLSVMLGVLAFTCTALLRYWIPVRQSIQFVTLWIALQGLFSLTLDDEMLFRGMYLQAICLAFTLCYIYMENSILVFAFLAVINLLLAFGGTVLAMKSDKAEEDTGS